MHFRSENCILSGGQVKKWTGREDTPPSDEATIPLAAPGLGSFPSPARVPASFPRAPSWLCNWL